MKAVAISQFGGLDELKEFDLAKPEPEDDEVLVRIHAAGVGIWDSGQRTGEFERATPVFPLVLGAECAGEVERVGSRVTTLQPGDAIYTYFHAKQGAYAQYVSVKAAMVARKPASLSYLEAAAVPIVAITAHQALVDNLRLQPHEWFFVAGGAGGVGSMAVQIAGVIGARVIASAAATDFSYLESLGVAPANLIDYQKSDVATAVRAITNGIGAHAALDAVGGQNSKQTIRAVRDFGRLAELTAQELPPERSIAVFHVQSIPSAERLDRLREMFDAGQLKAHVSTTFPLDRARDAQDAVEHGHRTGEVVISVE
jgi:NADPH:quinone reductase-like Zn-dependent oxidoreductase